MVYSILAHGLRGTRKVGLEGRSRWMNARGAYSAGPLNVLTHHKCASSWLERYLREFSASNALRMVVTQFSGWLPDRSPDILALRNASYDFVADKIEAGAHVIRNPLDIIVSAYHSHRNTHPLDEWPELEKQRRILKSVSERDGLFLTLTFLERDDFYDGAVGPLHALRHWNFDDERFCTIRMEDLVRDPETLLGSILTTKFPDSALPATCDHTFEAVSGRQIGTTDVTSHYRSGKVDQWREALPDEIVSYVSAHYADILKRYYPDSVRSRS
jgi:hypothetical protein